MSIKNENDKSLLSCSFCSCKESDVHFLVEGDDAYICDVCVDKASEIVKDKLLSLGKEDTGDRTPEEIRKKLVK